MAEARLVNDNYKTLDYTAAGTVTSGEILEIGDGRVGVAVNDMVSGDKGALQLDGLFDVLSASATTFTLGDSIYWDKSASLAVAYADADDIYIGTAVVAKVDGDTTVRVDLNVLTRAQVAADIVAAA